MKPRDPTWEGPVVHTKSPDDKTDSALKNTRARAMIS